MKIRQVTKHNVLLYVTLFLWLQAGSNVNADSGEHTPLQEAAEQGHTQCVAMLLLHDADIRRKGTCNQNVLDLVVFASLGMYKNYIFTLS